LLFALEGQSRDIVASAPPRLVHGIGRRAGVHAGCLFLIGKLIARLLSSLG
jgi:hypothetical protein